MGYRARPLRGLARSHRILTARWSCAVPVGAGKPAKGPVQATFQLQQFEALLLHRLGIQPDLDIEFPWFGNPL